MRNYTFRIVLSTTLLSLLLFIVYLESSKTFDYVYRTTSGTLFELRHYNCENGYLYRTGANNHPIFQILTTEGNAETCTKVKVPRT